MLVVLIVLTPLTVAWDWPPAVSAALLFVVILLLLVTGQTIIFLLRLVAADRRTRRRPMGSDTKTVGSSRTQGGPRPLPRPLPRRPRLPRPTRPTEQDAPVMIEPPTRQSGELAAGISGPPSGSCREPACGSARGRASADRTTGPGSGSTSPTVTPAGDMAELGPATAG